MHSGSCVILVQFFGFVNALYFVQLRWESCSGEPSLQVHWALEWTDHMPVPRVGVHLPYAQPYRTATNFTEPIPRLVQPYVELAGYYTQEGVCHAFPKGEVEECEAVLRYDQRQIWQYALDWYDWPQIKGNAKNSTFMYDSYRKELWCMYDKVHKINSMASNGSFGDKRRWLMEEMRRDCITLHSNS